MIEAFVVYYLLMLMLFTTWRLANTGSGFPRYAPLDTHLVLAFVSIVLYSLVLGLRYNVGGDYQGYVGYYKIISWRVSAADIPIETGFYWLVRALKFFQFPPASLFLATCCIQMLFMSIWLRRYSFLAHWVIYFFFTTLVVVVSMNAVRQTMAFMILLCAVTQLIDRKPWQYFILVGLASMLHWSALIFLPFYFILDKAWLSSRPMQIGILLLVYISANALKVYLFDMLPMAALYLGYKGYGHIQQALFFGHQVRGISPGLIFDLASDLIVITASPWLKRCYATQGFQTYYNLFYIGALLRPVVYFANYIPFSRLAFYFTGYNFVVLGFLVTGLFSRYVPSFWAKALGVALVVSYFGWFSHAIYKGAAWCAPFQFVFQ